MAEQTKIEWCDATFNPWMGCTKVGPGCDHCYAEVSTPSRTRGIQWGAGAARQRTSEANWKLPIRWNNSEFMQCANCKWRGDQNEWRGLHASRCCAQPMLDPARRRVFCASLADVFDNDVDPQWRADLFYLIYITPNIDWLILTKRIGNAVEMIDEAITGAHLRTANARHWPWANVWLGATVVNQAEADRDVPKLLQVPARVRFLSIEPMLGAVDLSRYFEQYPDYNGVRVVQNNEGPDWIIAGGESGPKARPMHPDWIRSLRDQCAAAAVPFLFKQHGEYTAEIARSSPRWDSRPDIWISLNGRCEHEEAALAAGGEWQGLWKLGKKAAGNKIDYRQHLEWPAHG